ncbi:MAG: hypothetical protein JO218_04055 [Burkholderiales bacterium]|nr:hypothetical protein [Burkholderiales bacterium]
MQPANILHIRSLGTGWCDKDEVLLHAAFQLLKDCVEQEHLLDGHEGWDFDDMRRNAKAELESLYHWWEERSKESADSQESLLSPAGAERHDADTEMLIRLVKVRWALWT